MKKRAFVRYSKQGKIVPGSLILTGGSYPQGPATWKEVPADLCCESPVTEPLIMEIIPDSDYYEFGFRVYNPNTVKGTIEWGDGTSEPFDLSTSGGYTFFGHTYSTPDYIPQTVKVYFTSVVGFRNLEIGDEVWKTLSVSNLTKIFKNSTIQQIDADDSLLGSLDVHDIPITQLYALNCPNLAYLNVQGCTSLDDVELFNDAFETLDFSGCTAVSSLAIFNNPNLTTVIIDDCPNITFLDVYDSILSSANIEYIITTLDNNGLSNGYLDLSGTNSSPSSAVEGNIISLGDKGWELYIN